MLLLAYAAHALLCPLSEAAKLWLARHFVCVWRCHCASLMHFQCEQTNRNCRLPRIRVPSAHLFEFYLIVNVKDFRPQLVSVCVCVCAWNKSREKPMNSATRQRAPGNMASLCRNKPSMVLVPELRVCRRKSEIIIESGKVAQTFRCNAKNRTK